MNIFSLIKINKPKRSSRILKLRKERIKKLRLVRNKMFMIINIIKLILN